MRLREKIRQRRREIVAVATVYTQIALVASVIATIMRVVE